MPRPLLLGLAVLLVAALTFWIWRSSSSPPLPDTGATAANHSVEGASGELAPGGDVERADASVSERTAADPTVQAPVYVVEGLVLGDRLRPDLSDMRVLAYSGDRGDRPGVQLPSFDPNGAMPAPSFVISGDPIASAAVDSQGSFVMRAAQPHLRLTIEHDVYLMPMPDVVHVPDETRTAEVVLAPVLGACVRGRLFGERAPDIDGVRLMLEPDPMSMMRDPRLFLGAITSSRSTATPDPDAAFEFRGVIPGAPFKLAASGKEAFGELAQPALVPGETREVALTVQNAASLEVRVVDSAGEPVPRARVAVAIADAAAGSMFGQLHQHSDRTDENGRCTIGSLAPARVNVEAMAAGYVGDETTVDLRAWPETNAAELTLGEGGVVTGTVFDPDGKPLADAWVAHQPSAEIPVIGDLASQLGPSMLAGIARESGVRTGADGRFRLPGLADDNEFLVVGAHDDYAASYASGVRMGDSDVEVTLVELGTVTGTVVTAANENPVPRFTVRIEKSLFLVMTNTVRTEFVESPDGSFRITAVPPGSYTAVFEAPGFAARRKDVTVGDAGDVDLGVIELYRGAVVAGTVRDDDGAPVRGALVRKRRGPMADNPFLAMFNGDTGSMRTDTEGRFRLESMPPGRVQLIASAEGYATGRSERIELTPGQQVDGLDISLDHGGTIEGRLLTGPGESPGDFMVLAQNQRSQVSIGADLAPDGTFVVRNLDPGTYIAQAMPYDLFDGIGGNQWRPGEGLDFGDMIEKIGGSIVQRRCTVRAGEVTEVELDAGDLIVGTRWTVRVEIAGTRLTTGIVEAVALEGGGVRASVLNGGRAVLSNVEPGPYRLQIRSGMTMAQIGAPQDVEFPAGKEEHTTTITLPGGEVRGRVVDAETGDPLRHALVRLIHEDAAEKDDPIGMALTDAEGNFAFPGLEDGRYGVVTAGHLDDRETGAASQRGIDVVSGIPTREVELRSQPAASASAVITNESGVPVAGATALCVDRDGRPLGALGIATTGPDGRAWFGGMPRGEARVVARAPGLAPGASDLLQLDPNGSVEFSLILTGGARTTVQAVDRAGRPLNGATITARLGSGPWLPMMLLVERVGPGSYELGRLSPGSWEFRVQHPGTGTLTQRRVIGSEPAITVVVAPE